MPFANGKSIHGWGHGLIPPNAQSDLTGAIDIGSAAIQVGGGRNGHNCVRLTGAATSHVWYIGPARNTSSAPTINADRVVVSFYARYIAFPPVSDTIMFRMDALAGNTPSVTYRVSDGQWRLVLAGGTTIDTGVVPTLNTWYRFDVIFRCDLNPRTATVWITQDGASTAVKNTVTAGAAVGSSAREIVLGNSSGTQTVEFADMCYSTHALALGEGDFPIFAEGVHHEVVPYLPDGDGTHSVGTATFQYTDNNGTGYTAITNGTTVSYSRVNVWPPPADADAADHWVEKAVGTTLSDLVEWTLPPSAETRTPYGVHVHSTVRNKSGTSTNSLELYLREGSTDAATLIHTGQVNSATKVYRGMCYPLAPDGTAWSSSHVNALKVRFSSNNLASIPLVKAVLAEAAYEVSTASSSLGSTSWLRAL